jgi:hypothetical protein
MTGPNPKRKPASKPRLTPVVTLSATMGTSMITTTTTDPIRIDHDRIAHDGSNSSEPRPDAEPDRYSSEVPR